YARAGREDVCAMANLKRRVVFSRAPTEVLAALVIFAASILCAAYPQPASSEPVPIWAVFTAENSDLPSNAVVALAFGADGALWAGTGGGGLARLDKDGQWRAYSKTSTNGGLPYDRVWALAFDADGALWAGTLGGGLARLDKDGQWRAYSKASTNSG